jgi:hypothetical protein
LKEIGFSSTEGLTVRVVENTADTVYLVLPHPPESRLPGHEKIDLKDQDLTRRNVYALFKDDLNVGDLKLPQMGEFVSDKDRADPNTRDQ